MPRFAAQVLFAILAVAAAFAMPAEAQTRALVINMSSSGQFAGFVNVFSDGYLVSACSPLSNNPCTVFLNQGANVEISADYPGSLSGGTGPAAACALSTCTFTMTGDASVSAAGSNAPFATLTTTLAGDGNGVLWVDAFPNTFGLSAPCQSNTCAVKYLLGSTVHLRAAPVGTARFTGYSSATGDASVCGSSPACTFTLTGDASATASFVALTSFAVSPSSAIAAPGGPSQTFTATGTYTSGPAAPIVSPLGAWSAAPSLPAGGGGLLAAATLGGKVYALGGSAGFSSQKNLNEFDPATQTWTGRAPMLTARQSFGAATAGGQLYAIGGLSVTLGSGSAVASVERYDPTSNTWTPRASMSAPRSGLAVGTINGFIYAAGGAGSGGVVSTLEAYDPSTDTWTTKAPMPTPRANVSGGVIDGILYVVGGSTATSWLSTVEAYDPATNTWTTKAPVPVPLASATAAVADGVLYVMTGRAFNLSVVYAYDPVTNTWSARTPMRTPLAAPAATALNGVVYAIGGFGTSLFTSSTASALVQTFVDTLRWSSSAPLVARVAQTGAATPLSPGSATIIANVGGTTCGGSCPTFIVPGPSTMSLDLPTANSSFTAGLGFTVGGWGLNTAAPSGTGVDAIHVYAFPASGPAIFLGSASYGQARPDVAAVYGTQFTNSGFTLPAAGSGLAPGTYTIFAAAHDALTGTFDAGKTTTIQIKAAVSNGIIAVDTPTAGQTVTSAFEVGGWAIDLGAPTGTGVDSVQFYIQPQGAPAPGVLIGTGSYGSARPDVAAILGSRFTNVGYHFTITGLGPGSFTLNIVAHSTVTNSYSIVKAVPITVSATALMSIDAPAPEQVITVSQFLIGGWTIDRTVEGTQLSGPGVDMVHVYAYPNPGSGQPPIFLGIAFVGVSRPDVGVGYGARYSTSGYNLVIDRVASALAPGVYSIAVHAHSTVTGTFNNVAVVRVTLQ